MDNSFRCRGGWKILWNSARMRLASAWRDKAGIAGAIRGRDRETRPTIFHVTHWKAGSQWIRRILERAAPGKIVAPQLDNLQIRDHPIRVGCLYPTVYLAKPDFDHIARPPDSRVFVVIRDLRDTLVSAYFSFKCSHPILDRRTVELRQALFSRNMENGLWFLMEHFLPSCAQIQLSWIRTGARIVKYEELLEDDVNIFEDVLIRSCGLRADPTKLRKIVVANRFEVLTGGRRRGVEDRMAHERKGIAGDWANYFTDGLKKEFKARFSGVLVETGYEKDLDW